MPKLDINPPVPPEQPVAEQPQVNEQSAVAEQRSNIPNILNSPPGYEWSDRWNSRKKVDTAGVTLNKAQERPPGLSPSDPHMEMENYDNLNSVEKWMGKAMPTTAKWFQDVGEYLPDPVQKTFSAIGSGIFKFMGVFDASAEFVERGSGFVRQWKLAAENDELENFQDNLGDAWAAGSLFYDVSNTPIVRDGKLTYHYDLPGTAELPALREQITELTDQGVGRKAALDQVHDNYMNSIGALSIRAAKQDMIGHVFLDPFMWLTLAGYAPATIVKSLATTASKTKYPAEMLELLGDASKIAKKAGDLEEVARIADKIAEIQKTRTIITAADRAAMFLTGEFPKPLAGYSKKIDDVLYYFGNTLAGTESIAGKAWRKINPFSLTPSARADDWLTRISDYVGTDILSRGTPEEITETFVKLASQATSGRASAMAVTSDGRMIQSWLRAGEVNATQLLNDFRLVAPDGKMLVIMAEKLGRTTPGLIEDILSGKADDIIKQLANLGDDGAKIASLLTKDTLKRLGALKGTPYTEELFRHMLHNNFLDDVARISILKFGIEKQGFVQKWTAFMKVGETLAFLRANPTFAFKNWINNEFTLVAEGVGGRLFGRGEDMAELVGKLGFGPLKANKAWTMAGMAGGELGDIGESAGKIIAKQLKGDITLLDKAAKKLQDVDLKAFDFGKLAQRMERSASQRALVKGYTRHWRQMWKPGGFTSASKFIPQTAIREIGEDVVRKLDNVVQGAESISELDDIFRNLSKIDLNKTTAAVVNEIENKMGINLVDQFGTDGAETIRRGIGKAIESGSPTESRKIFNDLFEQSIQNISKESNKALEAKMALFEQATESQRSMALLDLTEEFTHQLDIADYTYSVGMTRFRPMDVSKQVRDTYWPVWLKQQNAHFDNVWKRIEASVEGVRTGGKNINLDLNGAISGIEARKRNWEEFFSWRNEQYKLSKDNGWDNWDELVEDINTRYIKASDLDLSHQKNTDDLMEAVVRVNNPELADGFAGWRKELREWKRKDRALTRSYTYAQKKGELGVDNMTYAEFWKQRGELYQEWGNLKKRGYAMMEGDQNELARFSEIVSESGKVSMSQAKQIAKDLEGKQTTMRFMQSAESEMRPNFLNETKEEHWFSRGFFTLRELEEETLAVLKSPVSRLDVSDFSKKELGKYFNNIKREMADAQYVSLRMGEYTRDSALLNYSRRMNYDTWLGTFMPYEFWMTHSMGRWAIRSLNRPAMTSFYYRVRQLQDRVGSDDPSFPTRLKGKMRINIPGLPEWMGDSIYFDPLSIVMPFDTMTMPFQMAKQRGLSREGSVERELNRMVHNDEITQAQAEEALQLKSGKIFQDAISRTEGAGNQTDNYELLSALSSPHAPYDWAIKGLSGKPEEIGPFLPATFTVTRLLGMFGVDAPHEKANAAARMRRKMGLPGFDQWEDYRVERMLSNLSSTGEITPDQAARAMISHQGPEWELARQRSAKEYAGGPWWSTLLKTIGAPTYIYPDGEYLQREVGQKYSKAMEAYNNGNYEAYNVFWDNHPEFANRLALWDEPKDRMRSFLVDDVWNLYTDMASINKKIVRETLGEEFSLRFLDKNTANYEAIPIEQLQMWAKMMGGDPPGTLTEAFPINLAPPEIATQAQIFYDVRNDNFSNFYELQNKYFDLAEGTARKDYLRQNPELKQYWDWRRDFLKRNPSVATYIDDEFEPKYESVQEMEQAYGQEPTFTEPEYRQYLETPAIDIITDVYNNGFAPPPDIVDYLTEKAEELGITYDELIEKVGGGR
ncbi:MAG: hypothetical protein KAH23_04645 [Kiritimatiellae bacterium]|nr:hypothetical protein [Kiritimatiellia bacterium]